VPLAIVGITAATGHGPTRIPDATSREGMITPVFTPVRHAVPESSVAADDAGEVTA
jgi:hypothetical protein